MFKFANCSIPAFKNWMAPSMILLQLVQKQGPWARNIHKRLTRHSENQKNREKNCRCTQPAKLRQLLGSKTDPIRETWHRSLGQASLVLPQWSAQTTPTTRCGRPVSPMIKSLPARQQRGTGGTEKNQVARYYMLLLNLHIIFTLFTLSFSSLW